MRAALRAWGLDRASPDFRFGGRTLTSDRAVFENVVFAGTSADPSTADTLVITRNVAAGSDFGEFTVEFTKVSTRSGVGAARVSAVGMRGANNLTSLFSAMSNVALSSTPATTRSGTLSLDSLSLVDLTSDRKAGSRDLGVTIGEIVLTDFVFDGQLRSFKNLQVKNFTGADEEIEFKLGSFVLTGAGAGIASFVSSLGNAENRNFDVMTLGLEGLNIDDLSLVSKKPSGRVPLLDGFTLASLRLGGLNQGMLDRFSLSGFKLAAMAGNQRVQASLASMSAGGINMAYFAQVGGYIQASLKTATNGRKTGFSSDGAQASLAGPRIVLKDLLPGGPLDGGFTGFDLADLRADAGGIEFGLDKIEFSQQRNTAGIVTRADLAPSQLRISWANMQGPTAAQMSQMTSLMGSSEIVARFSLQSSFVPETDVTSLESYQIELVDWGRVNLGATMSGLTSFMANTSFSDLIPRRPTSSPNSAASAKAAMDDMIQIYRGITINSAQMDVTDLGGIDRAARLSTTMSRRGRASAPTSLTPLQIGEIRNNWAQNPRAMSGDKTKPPLARMFGLATARWFEGGGSMRITMAPPTPFAMSDFSPTTAPTVSALGLSITNQPQATR